MSCGAGHRRGSDAMWLWQRLADATLIRPLAWELPHATGVALKKRGEKSKIQFFSHTRHISDARY